MRKLMQLNFLGEIRNIRTKTLLLLFEVVSLYKYFITSFITSSAVLGSTSF